jgi:dolichol-phosphate mannosyltransferase
MTDIGESRFSLAYFRSFIKFSVVGATGVVVNEGLLIALQSRGVYLLYASTLAIEVSILSNFFLNDLWTFRDRRSGHMLVRLVKFNFLMLAGLVVNAAIVDVGVDYFSMAAAIANLIGIAAAFVLRYVLSVRYAWMRIESIEAGNPAPMTGPLAGPQSAPP